MWTLSRTAWLGDPQRRTLAARGSEVVTTTDGGSERQTGLAHDERWSDALTAYAERIHAAAGQTTTSCPHWGYGFSWPCVLRWPTTSSAAELAEAGSRPDGGGTVRRCTAERSPPLGGSRGGGRRPLRPPWSTGGPGCRLEWTPVTSPTQEVLGGWAREHTMGPIGHFPTRVSPTSSLCWPPWPPRSPGRPLRGLRCGGSLSEPMGDEGPAGNEWSQRVCPSRPTRRDHRPGPSESPLGPADLAKSTTEPSAKPGSRAAPTVTELTAPSPSAFRRSPGTLKSSSERPA